MGRPRCQVGPWIGRRVQDRAEVVVDHREGAAGLEGADPRELPALHEAVAFERELPGPAEDQPVLAMEVGEPAVEERARLIVLNLEQTFVREEVDRPRERVVDVAHEAFAEPLRHARLERVVARARVRGEGVGALVFVQSELLPAQLGADETLVRVVEEIARRLDDVH